jgi:hypothetical protein
MEHRFLKYTKLEFQKIMIMVLMSQESRKFFNEAFFEFHKTIKALGYYLRNDFKISN